MRLTLTICSLMSGMLVALACGRGDPAADHSTSLAPIPAMGDSTEPELDFPIGTGTAGTTFQMRVGAAPAVLREVRAASHTEFDRVVFEFDGALTPGYVIDYVDRPVRDCGSAEPIEVVGEGWLQVRMEPAYAHEGDTAITPTVTERDRRVDHPALRQLVLTCDFEGQVEWVLGVRSPNEYRVVELTRPARLVVDIRH
ncbi:MAG TPA: hypothetical protein VMM18_04505 [Gemmatimonadaceae bacterium]|nr:hypothetical protein [Gemmatimonadaceae bacterium]